jgi:hypothetical protein
MTSRRIHNYLVLGKYYYNNHGQVLCEHVNEQYPAIRGCLAQEAVLKFLKNSKYAEYEFKTAWLTAVKLKRFE